MNKNEKELKRFLEENNFIVNKINESSEEVCDFSMHDPNNKYLVELKSRYLDDNSFPLDGKVIDKNCIYGNHHTIDDNIKKGISQLNSIQTEPSKIFKILWYNVTKSGNEQLFYKHIKFRLYGIYYIFEKSTSPKECYYFTHSSFYSFKELDAVIIQSKRSKFLCLNNNSCRYSILKKTMFYNIFNNSEIIDPVIDEQNNKCYIADCNYDRNNCEKIKMYVKNKYNLSNIYTSVPENHRASVFIPDK